MQITVNGQPKQLAAAVTIGVLLHELHLGQRRVAVELNGEIVPRSRAGETRVQAGDRIEIVHAIGGG